MRLTRAALLALAAGACGSSAHLGPGADAGTDATSDCAAGAAGQPTELRCTGLYADWNTKTLAPGVRPYDPGLHLWSDGADKARWIYLPPGTQIDTSNMDQWTFPKGTKILEAVHRQSSADRDAPPLEASHRRLVRHHVPLVGRLVARRRADRRRGRSARQLRDPHTERLLRLPQRPVGPGAGVRGRQPVIVGSQRRDPGDAHCRESADRPAGRTAGHPRRRQGGRRAGVPAHQLRHLLPQPGRPGRRRNRRVPAAGRGDAGLAADHRRLDDRHERQLGVRNSRRGAAQGVRPLRARLQHRVLPDERARRDSTARPTRRRCRPPSHISRITPDWRRWPPG